MVESNPDILLGLLRRKLGTGGTHYGSTVEIMGLHDETIRAFLFEHSACLRGLNKALIPAPPAVVEASDAARSAAAAEAAEAAWWANGDAKLERRKPRHKRKEPELPLRAACATHNTKPRCPMNWPYCGGWCYEPDSDGESGTYMHALDAAGVGTSWLLNDDLGARDTAAPTVRSKQTPLWSTSLTGPAAWLQPPCPNSPFFFVRAPVSPLRCSGALWARPRSKSRSSASASSRLRAPATTAQRAGGSGVR